MMQAFDSVKIDADVELGGMDQKFNVLRGRELQKSMGKEPQVGIFMPILLGLDGVQKMSKSLGNCIGINESARDMVRKIISMPDSLIRSFFELLTDVSLEEIEERLTTGDPRNLKETLALIIASKYHGARACFDAMEEERERNEAKKNGDNTFVPSDIPTFKISGTHAISWLLREAGLCASSTLATNFIKNRTVCWDGEVVSDPKQKVDISGEHILKLGNKKWAKICQN
jgi:tyrosyl-tRNA synthetase